MKIFKKRFMQFVAMVMSLVIGITEIGQMSSAYVQAAEQKNVKYSSTSSYEVDDIVITFEVTSHWDTGYNAQVTITNTSPCKIDNWKLKCFMPDDIINIWNAKADKVAGNTYVLSNLGWNQDINVGDSISFGYTAGNPIESFPTFELIANRITTVDSKKYVAECVVSSEWNTGFTGDIYITNLSAEVLEDWKVSVRFDGEINNIWNATILSVKDNVYDIDNNGYNGNILPNQTVSFGFLGTKNSETSPVITMLSAYDETCEFAVNSEIEMMELPDGKIEKAYIEKAIYPRLVILDQPVDNICLADDYDGDGLNLIQEYEYDTDPFEKDTDNDGLSDYDEVMIYYTNPWNNDSDNDGLFDGTEVLNGLDPLRLDTNGDGVSDDELFFERDVRLRGVKNYTLESEGNVPRVIITGKGEFNDKIKVEAIKDNKSIVGIESLVGTAYEFSHDELSFDNSKLQFEISEKILAEHNLSDLVIANYDYETGELNLLDTEADYINGCISAEVEHYSTYLIIDVVEYLKNIVTSLGNDGIRGSKADIVFVIDTTGSMSEAISDVKNNIQTFAGWLAEEKIDARLGLVEYRDIYVEGVNSTKNYGWFSDVNSFRQKISSFVADGGGDWSESAVDALYSAANMTFRSGIDGYIILVTDAGYKIGTVDDNDADMTDAISKLVKRNISVSVATDSSYSYYDELVSETGGIKTDIYSDFKEVFGDLLKKIKVDSSQGCWILLSDNSYIHLDKHPDEGDYSVDTDGDGIPDLVELGSKYTDIFYDNKTGPKVTCKWTFFSNPADCDTDGDGIEDGIDLSPRNHYDICPVEENSEYILFNNGDKWMMYNYIAEEYITGNKMTTEEFCHVRDDIIKVNNSVNFNMEELTYICIENLYGLQIYMTQSDYRDDNDSLELFESIVSRKAKFFQHKGILGWSHYEEVDYGTKGGFFKGQVRTEADYNVNIVVPLSA